MSSIYDIVAITCTIGVIIGFILDWPREMIAFLVLVGFMCNIRSSQERLKRKVDKLLERTSNV